MVAYYQRIDVDSANELVEKENALLLDYRRQRDYKKEHATSARLLDQACLDELVQMPDKSRLLVIYCYRGYSSRKIAQYLGANGFQFVYSVDGGFAAWKTKFETTSEGSL